VSVPSWLDAAGLALEHEAVASDQVVEGEPATGLWEADNTWGVWEMTPGAMWDIEVDELFVVISGSGTLERVIDGDTVVQALQPGVACRLVEGEKTVWRVNNTLRKVYWVPQS
jgi:uncharacterized cupin superfamily protein